MNGRIRRTTIAYVLLAAVGGLKLAHGQDPSPAESSKIDLLDDLDLQLDKSRQSRAPQQESGENVARSVGGRGDGKPQRELTLPARRQQLLVAGRYR